MKLTYKEKRSDKPKPTNKLQKKTSQTITIYQNRSTTAQPTDTKSCKIVFQSILNFLGLIDHISPIKHIQ